MTTGVSIAACSTNASMSCSSQTAAPPTSGRRAGRPARGSERAFQQGLQQGSELDDPVAGVGHAPADRHREPTGHPRHLGQQPALPHPGPALDHHDRPDAGQQAVQVLTDQRELAVPASDAILPLRRRVGTVRGHDVDGTDQEGLARRHRAIVAVDAAKTLQTGGTGPMGRWPLGPPTLAGRRRESDDRGENRLSGARADRGPARRSAPSPERRPAPAS